MASSSTTRWKYDVFISFRGEDTRNDFTSFLYDALCRKKINTFIDNRLDRGEEITPALLRIIEESHISVIVFSENYASSPWCLDELVKILECRESFGQVVLPVFYHVDPSDVETQSGIFSDAFVELERTFQDQMHKVSRWKASLTNAANISGLVSKVIRPESKLVNEIVQCILKHLNNASSGNSESLVGIDSRIEEVKMLLRSEVPDVRMIGIWGMGGIGKTTVAGVIFNNISHEYEASCFLANITGEAEKCGGLVHLRDRLFSEILEEEDLHIVTPLVGSISIKERFQRKKVLVVLDDVNDVAQMEFIIGARYMFGPGSRIIITSRDKQVLKNGVDQIYDVKGLNSYEALQLFSLHAFKENHPKIDYTELSKRAIKYAQGSPLALKVLGSSLFDRTKKDWESALSKLERIPHPKVHSVLKISFDQLDDEEKSIFLDIACFFEGHHIDFVKRILDGCGFSTDIGFSVLVDKCLISISENKISMHDLLQDMAHEIIRQESINELGKRSRLWNPNDVYQVLTKNLGTEKVQGIFLDISKAREMKLSSNVFAKMHNLRLLKIYNSTVGNFDKVCLPYGLDSLSDELRYLHWAGYPLRSLPMSFIPENLVELNLIYSNVEQPWTGIQNLVSLKEINLSNCKNLIAIPDLSHAKNLEAMNFQYCTSLVEVPVSVQSLHKLSDLDFRYCTSLVSVPNSSNLTSLKALNLSGCCNLKECPELAGNLTYLNLNETAIEELPQSVGNLRRLVTLNLKGCKKLRDLPSNIFRLESLQIVDLSGCSNITTFPNVSYGIRYLYLSHTAITELPFLIGHLSVLSSLDLTNCKNLKELPCTFSHLASLKKLILSGCSSITRFPEVPTSIKELYLDGTEIKEIPSSIECFSELVELNMQNCREFEILPSSILKLKSLQKLNLSGCSKFGTFPLILEPMKSLIYLNLSSTAIRNIPYQLQQLSGLESLELGNCKNLKLLHLLLFSHDILGWSAKFEYLRRLYLNDCNILEVPDGLCCIVSLEELDLSGNMFERLPYNISELPELQFLNLRNCRRLKYLPELPQNLAKVNADYCISLRAVSRFSLSCKGNAFDFFFINCFSMGNNAVNCLMKYTLKKIHLYATRLYNQTPLVSEGTSSFCFPGSVIPKWFGHQSCGSSINIQLPLDWASSDFIGFNVCAVVAFDHHFDGREFQLKCSYHFKTEDGDCLDLHCTFGSWYRPSRNHWRFISAHLFVGYDPCLDVIKDEKFSKSCEVTVEFYPENMVGYALHSCNVIMCAARLLYAQDKDYHSEKAISRKGIKRRQNYVEAGNKCRKPFRVENFLR